MKGGVFIPKFTQLEQLAALNDHDDEEVAQYSVYAMVRQRDVSVADLSIPLHAIAKKPESVRKWVYRLLTKDGSVISRNIDFVQEVARHERAVRAQEGLALGLGGAWVDGLEPVVVDWYARRPEERVEEALLSHMARHSAKASSYSEIVLNRFGEAPSNSLRRSQLLASAAGTPLYGDLQRVVFQDNSMGDLFAAPSGGLYVNGNNNIILSGGNNQATGLATGGSVSVERVSQTLNIPPERVEELKAIVERAREDASPEAKVVVEQADRFFAEPSSDTGRSLGGALLALGGTALGRAADFATVADYLNNL